MQLKRKKKKTNGIFGIFNFVILINIYTLLLFFSSSSLPLLLFQFFFLYLFKKQQQSKKNLKAFTYMYPKFPFLYCFHFDRLTNDCCYCCAILLQIHIQTINIALTQDLEKKNLRLQSFFFFIIKERIEWGKVYKIHQEGGSLFFFCLMFFFFINI